LINLFLLDLGAFLVQGLLSVVRCILEDNTFLKRVEIEVSGWLCYKVLVRVDFCDHHPLLIRMMNVPHVVARHNSRLKVHGYLMIPNSEMLKHS
jgi:hypothetical protein